MGKRGPEKREGSNTAMLSIRLPEAMRAEIKAAFSPDEIREVLVDAALQKKTKKDKNRVDRVK